jgi:integrase
MSSTDCEIVGDGGHRSRHLESTTETKRPSPLGKYREAFDELGPESRAHGLRHTTASLAISAGANVKVVQRLLGHATASMTLDRQKADELALNTR